MRTPPSDRLQLHVLRLGTLVLLLLYLAGALSVGAQVDSPYRLSPGKELALYGFGGATFGLGTIASARLDLLSAEDLQTLTRDEVWKFDRSATRRRSESARLTSDVLGYGATALPLALLVSPEVRANAVEVGVLYSQVLLVNAGATQLVKNTVRRTRPYVYNDAFTLEKRLQKDGRRSFFSGHTSNAAASAFFAAQVFSDFYPNSKAKPWVWTAACLIPAATGATRVLSGNHYVTDVVVGYAVGAGIGLLVPRLHRVINRSGSSRVHAVPPRRPTRAGGSPRTPYGHRRGSTRVRGARKLSSGSRSRL